MAFGIGRDCQKPFEAVFPGWDCSILILKYTKYILTVEKTEFCAILR
jgi:hypothetical protein